MDIEGVNVLSVGVSVVDQDRAREFLFEAARAGRRGYVTVTGVHGVTEAQNDPILRDIFSRALLITPDGEMARTNVHMTGLTSHLSSRLKICDLLYYCPQGRSTMI